MRTVYDNAYRIIIEINLEHSSEFKIKIFLRETL